MIPSIKQQKSLSTPLKDLTASMLDFLGPEVANILQGEESEKKGLIDLLIESLESMQLRKENIRKYSQTTNISLEEFRYLAGILLREDPPKNILETLMGSVEEQDRPILRDYIHDLVEDYIYNNFLVEQKLIELESGYSFFMATPQEKKQIENFIPPVTTEGVKNWLSSLDIHHQFSIHKLKTGKGRQILNVIKDEKLSLHSICIGQEFFSNRLEDISLVSSILSGVTSLQIWGKHSMAMNDFRVLTSQLGQLRSLSLIGINFMSHESYLMEDIFRRQETLRHMTFENCPLNRISPEIVKKIGFSFPHLRYLNCTQCHIGEFTIEGIDALFGNAKEVRSLNLTNNNLGSMESDVSKHFFKSIPPKVKHLSIGGNNFCRIKDKTIFMDALRHLTQLESLEIDENGLNLLSIKELEYLFSQFKHVKTIWLGEEEGYSPENEAFLRQLLPNTTLKFTSYE